jgi:hypothetical protein
MSAMAIYRQSFSYGVIIHSAYAHHIAKHPYR